MKQKHKWRVMAEFSNLRGYTRFYVYRRKAWWWDFHRVFDAKEDAIAYAERAARHDVPPVQVWP